MSATETLLSLAEFNSWRRGDETIEMPSPAEIGASIDDAVNLLRKYADMEHQLAEARKDSERLAHLAKIARIQHGDCDRESLSFYVIHVPTGRHYEKSGADLPLTEAIDAARALREHR